MILKVRQQEKEGYKTVQEAIDMSGKGDIIDIGVGVYNEKIIIETPGIIVQGAGSKHTKIYYADYAKKQHKDGKAYSTFRTATVYVGAEGVQIKDMTIENGAGDGRCVGQAIAVYIDGDQFIMTDCYIIGHQDTLFCGPLPKAPRIPGSFVGPGENKSYKYNRQDYKRCHIKGDIDFVFGSAYAVFTQCEFISRDRKQAVNGYVFAPSTYEHEPFGFVAIECDFIGESGIKQGSCYLGRPWRSYGKTTLISCRIGSHIHPMRWDEWGDEINKETARFEEYACKYEFLTHGLIVYEEAPFIKVSKEPLNEVTMRIIKNIEQSKDDDQ